MADLGSIQRALDSGHYGAGEVAEDVRALLEHIAELELERDDWAALDQECADLRTRVSELKQEHAQELEALRREHAHELHQACLEARDDMAEALTREREGF